MKFPRAGYDHFLYDHFFNINRFNGSFYILFICNVYQETKLLRGYFVIINKIYRCVVDDRK
ncbi:MAG: hypothetical protein CIT01_02870 [Methanobacterium sp. BRmetb2]|nr:MAG: hypothetical protein CIT01_02870 [Methanobacterium sp. BRmetb2]